MSNTIERVADVARRIADPRYKDFLTPTSLLLEKQMFDSFRLLQLVTELDEEFVIALRTEDLTPQNFCTITDIAALVNRYIADGTR